MENKDGSFRDGISMGDFKTMIKVSEEVLHDFKNILSTISGLSQLSMLKTDSEEVKNNLRTITRSVFDCRDSLDMLFSVIKGGQEIKKEPKVLNQILKTTIDMIKFRVNEKSNVKLKLNLKSKAVINCIEYEVRQSILNILFNALDAMEGKPGILEINTYDTDKMAVVEFIDNGVGIPEENIHKIFDPYYTTKGIGGTGLGMKIVKDATDSHGATINIESKLGEGTKISILTPIFEESVEDMYLKRYNND